MSEPKQRYPPRSQFFTFVLYPREDITHKNILDILLSPAYYKDVRCIEHNKDYKVVDSDFGVPFFEQKKAHTHVIFHTTSRCGIDDVSAIIGLPTHDIEVVKSIQVYKLYLLHLDFQSQLNGKTPYPESELLGGLPFFDDNVYDESQLLEQCITMIENGISYKKLIVLLNKQHKLKFLRKYRSIILDLYDNPY